MKKKVIGIFIIMLMISSAMTAILFSDKVKVEASGGEPQGDGCVNLDYDWVWGQVQNFSWVINRTNWSAENNISKGRCWATAGENYTIDEILEPNMNGTDKPCGLTGYKKLPIGYLPGCYQPPERLHIPKQYSSKIVIHDYNLTIYNNSQLYKYLPYSELFPIGVGCVRLGHNINQDINRKFNFTNATIKVKSLLNGELIGELIQDHRNVSCTLLNAYTTIVGQVLYLNTTDPVPENHDCVFILHEEPASENKLDNLTDADGCILIENSTQSYTFENSTQYNFAIMKLNGTNSNFSAVLSEIKYGSNYTVDNLFNNEVLVFSNYSNASCCPSSDYISIVQLKSEGEYWKLISKTKKWSCDQRCKGVIISSPKNDTHIMTHTIRDWKWFGGFPNYYTDRYALPILSVNKTIGKYLIDNKNNVTVTGFLRQEYRQQTNDTPGVISHNAVAYRNINYSPDDAIVVLSNRMDGYWGETPGDSGVGGAILLGIAKYFKDNNITPKYNLTFLFTTAEECGMRGAQHYVDSHPRGTGENESNFKYWIGFDQLGFHNPTDAQHTLSLRTNAGKFSDIRRILQEIEHQTNYQKRTNSLYKFKTEWSASDGAEDFVWDKTGVDTILLEKGDNWEGHHQVGKTFSEGDSLKYIDRNDVNVTFELAWNVTKYFTVNPNCWFNGSATYVAVDSPDDTDSYNDSINATFSIKTILPYDRLRVKAKLINWTTNETVIWKNFDFDATSAGITKTITVTLPPSTTNLPTGNYRLMLELYNSTGRIDEIVFLIGGGRKNDSDLQSNYMYLHPRSNIDPNKPVNITGPHTLQFLQTGTFNTSTTDSNNDHVQYQWYWEPFDFDKIGPYGSGDTCSVKHKFHGPGLKTIYVRAREDYYGYLFDGPLSLVLKRYGDWGEWSNPFNVNVKLLTDFNMACTKLASSQNVQSSTKLPSVLQINSLYNALIFGGTEPNTYQWNFSGDTSQEKNVEYHFSGTGTKTVTLNVTDNDGYSNEISVNVTVVNLSASYNLSIPSLYADPGEEEAILFNDTSAVSNGYHITNWTWDFGDGTICYDRNMTHLFDALGEYNVTLTVTDNESETNVYYQIITVDYDECPPEIIYVGGSPDTVGFGTNVSIAVDATDDISGVDSVSINVTNPDNASVNYMMTHVINDTYFFVFNDTWQPGVYNYSIWVVDQANNTNCTSGFNFTVSAEATISIATLQDTYTGDEYINITDPPNPPENYILVNRGLTWDTYYNADTGQNILEISSAPINYQEDDGTWIPINDTLCQLTSDHPAYGHGYRTGNNRGLYGVYFKPNAQSTWPVAFAYNRSDDPSLHVIRSKLVGVGYVDPACNWAYEYLQSVQSSQGQTVDNTITYEDVFTGTDITWTYGNVGVKEEIILSNTTKTLLQNHPPSQYGLNNASSYLVFITRLDYQNLDLYNESGMLPGNVTVSDAGVEFKDALEQFRCALPLGEAYELNNVSARETLTYRIIHLNDNTYLLSGLKISDLIVMRFPVVIDPTLTMESLSNDGYITSSSISYSTAWNASSGTVDSSANSLSIGQKKTSGMPGTYSIYRGFVIFNTSALPTNAYLDNAILSLYKKDDYSTTDFLLTIQNGQPTYPHNPLQAGDYDRTHYSGNSGSLNTVNFTTGRNNITLTTLDWINTTGLTKLCLRSSRDINGNAPSGNEYVNIWSHDAPGVNDWPKLVISYRNQSKIKNVGSTNIKGYLLIQIRYYNISQGKWLVDNDIINESSPRMINISCQLALDTIFNGIIQASNLKHGVGTYRVYAEFRDPEGNVLRTNDETELKSWWQFTKT